MEFDHYRVIKVSCSVDSTILKEYVEHDRVYDVLEGLNLEYDQVWIQILRKEKVTRLNEMVAIIRNKESRKELMLETPTTENSTMVKGGTTMTMRKSMVPNIERKCDKSCHTKEKFWKLHGKPPCWEWKQKGGPQKKGGQGQAHIVNRQSEEFVPIKPSYEEIERARSFLSKLKKPISMCAQTYFGKFPFSFGFNASYSPFASYWIPDFGATGLCDLTTLILFHIYSMS